MRTYFDFMSHQEVVVRGHKWHNPELEPVGIVVISHGMAEHILRYEPFAEFLLDHRFVVYGHSHRGHGETAQSIDGLGYLGTDGWNRMVADLETVIAMARSEYPQKPITIFAHSMGSYVARDWMTRGYRAVSGIILSGTGYPSKIDLQIGLLLANLELTISRRDRPSKMLDKLSFGKFNARIENPKTPFDWLSRDEAIVKAYIESPYCGQIHPSGFFVEMAEALLRILYGKADGLRPEYPIFVLSGEADPVGGYVKGVMKVVNQYKNAGFKVATRLFPEGRHEMLNEINRQEVQASILKWLEDGVGKG